MDASGPLDQCAQDSDGSYFENVCGSSKNFLGLTQHKEGRRAAKMRIVRRK